MKGWAVLATAATLCLGAIGAWADDVTYTNAELTEMASQKVKPNITQASGDSSGTGLNSTLNTCKRRAGNRVANYYATSVHRDETEFYEILGYDTDRFFNVTCHPEPTEVEFDGDLVTVTRWIDTRTAYEYALPKWVDGADDDESDSTEDTEEESQSADGQPVDGSTDVDAGPSVTCEVDSTSTVDADGDVTYTNSELIAMSEIYLRPNVVETSAESTWQDGVVKCHQRAKAFAETTMVQVNDPNLTGVASNLSLRRMGYDTDGMKIGSCRARMSGTGYYKWRLTKKTFDYALPKSRCIRSEEDTTTDDTTTIDDGDTDDGSGDATEGG